MSETPPSFDPKFSWDSDEDDLIDDFYRPAMATCERYQRLAGYFSSTTFAIIIDEAIDFIERGGKIQLVTSHKLSKQDSDQIKKAVQTPEEVLSKNIIAELSQNTDSHIEKCISVMGYMLANNQLEIKIAIPDSVIDHPLSIYHQKTGIMYFPNKKIVTFTGSVNETGQGWKYNDEDFFCFKSGVNTTHDEAIEKNTKKFEKFWGNNANSTKVYELPEAVKQHLIRTAPKLAAEFKKIIHELRNESTYGGRKLIPWTCQKAGRDAFVNADYNGILKMATGTGKTSTAYIIFKQFFHDKKSTGNRVLVIVPTGRDRVGGQWEEFLFTVKKQSDRVYLYESAAKSQDKKDAEYVWNNLPVDANLYLIIVKDSIVKFPFNGIKPDLLVADEVHTYGTVNLMSIIKNTFSGTPYKLGLSATPERFHDKVGTKQIFDFFGKTVYTLCLKTAQDQPKNTGKENVLSQYHYRVDFVDLTEEEEKSVAYWTTKIYRDVSADEENSEAGGILSPESEHACIQRSKVCKKAKNKIKKFREIIQEIDQYTTSCLIYCADAIEHSIQAENVFKELGITEYVNYNHKIRNKSEALRLFKQKQARYIISVEGLNEGVDIPQCNTLILLSSSTNPREFIQRRGRVLRNYANKPPVKIFDISALPSVFNERGYRGLIEGRLRQIWEFIHASKNPEQKRQIDPIRQKYNISEGELQDKIDEWCHD